MADEKRYFWLRLYDDFFTSKRIKKLRGLAGGDTYTIIYLKMQLKALKTEGYLYFDSVMNDFAEELALDIDEKPDDVRVTIQYLLSVGLLECSADGEEYFLTFLPNLIGSETASAQRVRDFRQKKKEEKSLHCNKGVTDVKRVGNVEKEIEKDKEKEIDINTTTPPAWEEDKHTNIENFDHLIETEMKEGMNPDLIQGIKDWLIYKDHKKPKRDNHYQLESIRKLANRTFKEAQTYGVESVIGVIDSSIMNNYQGIIWDSLEKTSKKKNKVDVMKL